MKLLKYIFSVLALIVAGNSYSQQLRFKHITNEEGLSTNYVTSIMQDDRGFMWFGTQDGLNKYDGYGFTIFKNDPTTLQSLSSSEITCLKQLQSDLIIVGTRDGINFFNPITLKFTRLNNLKGTNVKINAIAVLNNDNIILGSDEGLFSVNISSKNFKKIIFPIDGPVIVNCIKEINGKFFIGTKEKGLWLYSHNKLERINFVKPDHLNVNVVELESINCLQEYAGMLYVGTNGFGIFKISLDNFDIEDRVLFTNLPNNNLNFINYFVINGNRLYAATSYGFIVYNLLNSKIINNENKESSNPFRINDNLIKTVFLDSQGNAWLGSQLGGVNVCFSRSIKFPDFEDDKLHQYQNLYSFLETRTGERVIGGENVLVFINKNKEITDRSEILGDNTALCIFQENENVFWIGTWGLGLIRFDKATNKAKTFLSSKFGGTVICLKADGRGNLLVGTFGDGLFRVNLKTFETVHYGVKEGLPNLNINTMFSDSKGGAWLGTYDGGLIKLKKFPLGDKISIEAVYKNEGKPENIATNIVFGVNEDKNGNIWAATSAGLSKLLPNKTFYNFYEKDGLPNTYLYSLIKDSVNNFWMSSNYGIIKFDPLVKESEVVFKSYGIKDGLLNTEYNIGAAFSSPSGNMYFGGSKGYNVFRPTQIKDNLHAPSSFIIGYNRGGKDVAVDSFIAYKKYLKLSWRENYFQFELAALDYTDPSKNKFKYKLEGYDNDWSEPTNVRYVSYTELPGGEYKFLVKATNNDGVWNENPYEITIEVVPPFWKTKLFYFLLIIFAGGGIYAFTQYRTRAIKKENKILENKVAERTRELEEKNNDITSSITYAKRIQEAILPSKDQIFKKLNRAFILYQPKDIVSGDFYWFAEKNGIKILAVVDCTGHGVPGAFMSMIGHNLLHQIVSEKGITDPADILNNLHKGVQEALRQGQNEINTNDGMDVSLITINDTTKEIKWAGANRPLITVDSTGEFLKFDGNKFPVGGAQLDINRVFTTQIIKLKNPAMAYLTSDGYADQFGGDRGKKYMVKRFHDLLCTIHLHSPDDQKKELMLSFNEWRQNHEQVDDVLVVGIGI
ncbi:MAG: two-component regulator propeller domain-containing protein [Bacteroidota bacterium]|nr:two-component regulator propeller domain-containing protein [Bacteroidota bacterium]